jgi:hypothetical protein
MDEVDVLDVVGVVVITVPVPAEAAAPPPPDFVGDIEPALSEVLLAWQAESARAIAMGDHSRREVFMPTSPAKSMPRQTPPNCRENKGGSPSIDEPPRESSGLLDKVVMAMSSMRPSFATPHPGARGPGSRSDRAGENALAGMARASR